MTIPEIREHLNELADKLEEQAQWLRYLAKQTYRRKPLAKAPAAPKHKQVRPPRAALIAFKAAHPNLSNHDVANHFGMRNQGRVSDIINGVRR